MSFNITTEQNKNFALNSVATFKDGMNGYTQKVFGRVYTSLTELSYIEKRNIIIFHRIDHVQYSVTRYIGAPGFKMITFILELDGKYIMLKPSAEIKMADFADGEVVRAEGTLVRQSLKAERAKTREQFLADRELAKKLDAELNAKLFQEL